MTGWNLPPGVNVSDIPGNRREDILWEKESEAFCESCPDGWKCDHDINICEHSDEFEEKFEDRLINGSESHIEEYLDGKIEKSKLEKYLEEYGND